MKHKRRRNQMMNQTEYAEDSEWLWQFEQTIVNAESHFRKARKELRESKWGVETEELLHKLHYIQCLQLKQYMLSLYVEEQGG